jgi:hypothetical protein
MLSKPLLGAASHRASVRDHHHHVPLVAPKLYHRRCLSIPKRVSDDSGRKHGSSREQAARWDEVRACVGTSAATMSRRRAFWSTRDPIPTLD